VQVRTSRQPELAAIWTAVFTYAEAETLLGELYGVPDQATQRGAFRGRLKHLSRLGVPLDSRPGKGARVAYDVEHLYQWAFCLELEEFGLDPTVIVRFLRAQWYLIGATFKAAAKDDRELFMVLTSLRLMSSTWRPVLYPDGGNSGGNRCRHRIAWATGLWRYLQKLNS